MCIKILECDKIFIPINQDGSHWVLAVINFMDRRFEYYDSMFGHCRTILQELRQYVKDEAKTYSGQDDYEFSEWTDYIPKDIPGQENGFDCGVFMCMYANYLSDGLDIVNAFDQDYVTRVGRRRMVSELKENYID